MQRTWARLFLLSSMLAIAACHGSDGDGRNSLTVETTEVQEEGTGGYSDDGGEMTYRPSYYMAEYIIITSRVDDVRIDAVDVNRGNCSSSPLNQLPVDLKFGETLRVKLGCKPLEVDVTTGEFVQTYKFNDD